MLCLILVEYEKAKSILYSFVPLAYYNELKERGSPVYPQRPTRGEFTIGRRLCTPHLWLLEHSLQSHEPLFSSQMQSGHTSSALLERHFPQTISGGSFLASRIN